MVHVLGELPVRCLRVFLSSKHPSPSASCPTECRLSRSPKPWKCIVSLRRTLPSGELRHEPFGEPIYEDAKSEVEGRIRRAQLAILNPSKQAKDYLTAEEWELGQPELTFSKDCVSLAITGPDVADLSFVDLPGEIFVLSFLHRSRAFDRAIACRVDCERGGNWQ